MKLIIYTDGASRGNPGHASYGFTISDEKGELIYQEGKYIGIATNNVAEYMAVLKALKYVEKEFSSKTPVQIELFADSMLVVKQLSGQFKLKNEKLKVFFDQIKILELSYERVFYNYIPRQRNKLADKLANLALDLKLH